MRRLVSFGSTFCGHRSGSITMIAAFAFIVVAIAGGLAIDTSRAYNIRTQVLLALDAAALAGAKSMQDDTKTDSDLSAISQAFFSTYVANMKMSGVTTGNFSAAVDRANWTVTASVDIRLPMLFGKVAGLDGMFDFRPESRVRYQADKVELALVLDVTGSMSDIPGGDTARKIDSMKAAAADVIDGLMGKSISEDSVRIAVAPFSASVNAGPLSYTVSASPPATTCGYSWRWGWSCTDVAGADVDTCVIERTNSQAATDAPPTGADILPAVPSTPYGNYSCPNAKVVPLLGKSNADQLKTTINGYSPLGATAGHIGAAWGWYVLSPRWSSYLPSGSAPAAYSDTAIHKHVVFMTDGLFNTSYLNGPSSSDQVNESYAQFQALCTNMKAQGITVWTIGFDLHNGRAIQELRHCGGDKFYDAKTGVDLKAAFQAIAASLNKMHVSQ